MGLKSFNVVFDCVSGLRLNDCPDINRRETIPMEKYYLFQDMTVYLRSAYWELCDDLMCLDL